MVENKHELKKLAVARTSGRIRAIKNSTDAF